MLHKDGQKIEKLKTEEMKKKEWRTRWAPSRHHAIHLEPNAKPHHSAVREQDKSHLYTVQEPNNSMKNYNIENSKMQKENCLRELLITRPTKDPALPQGKPKISLRVPAHC